MKNDNKTTLKQDEYIRQLEAALQVKELESQLREREFQLKEHELQLKDKQLRTQEEKIVMLENKMDWLLEQVRLSQHKQFGPSSEKTTFEGQMSLVFNETEGFEGKNFTEPTLQEITYKRKKKVGQKEEILEDLPVETVIYELPQEEQLCPDCGDKRHVLGKEVRRELIIIPPSSSEGKRACSTGLWLS